MASKPTDDRVMIELATASLSQFLDLFREAMKAEQDMHSASLQASQQLLDRALKGAENCGPENFSALLGALERVELARISALEKVALATLENGKQGIKMLENTMQIAVEAALGFAKVEIEKKKTRIRERETEIKERNSQTEAKKARGVVNLENGIHA